MFVGRRPDGTIYGTWTSRQPQDADHLNVVEEPDNHPDVVAFQNRPIPDRSEQLRTAIDNASNLSELKQAVKGALGL